MAYEPTSWQTGDIVTAEKLNKLENGVISGAVYIPIAYDVESDIHSISASYNDVTSMIENGQSVFGIMDGRHAPEGAIAKELFLIAGYASMPASHLYLINFISLLYSNDILDFGATDPDASMTTEHLELPSY